jgi:hypothetical protein
LKKKLEESMQIPLLL